MSKTRTWIWTIVLAVAVLAVVLITVLKPKSGEEEEAAADMSTQVLDRISKYVGDGPQNWKRTLVTPLRNKTLTPAANLLLALAEADTTFTTALHEPVTAALDRRAQIRAQIAALRAANQL